MIDILKSIVKWTEDTGLIPEIYFQTISGGIWLVLKLQHHGKCLQHEFYIPGGVLCLQNWEMFPYDEEINQFIQEAKKILI